jgi:hypothetical protein
MSASCDTKKWLALRPRNKLRLLWELISKGYDDKGIWPMIPSPAVSIVHHVIIVLHETCNRQTTALPRNIPNMWRYVDYEEVPGSAMLWGVGFASVLAVTV